MTAVIIICIYLSLLLGLGIFSHRFLQSSSKDFFVASHSIGSVLLLMSVFGTTMTAFAMVGSTAESYAAGIGVYGKMASWSGLIHSAVFFLVGIKMWSIGRKYGYVTQVQLFRDRFESNGLGFILFPILVALVIPYLLVSLLGAGSVVKGVTVGVFPDLFPAINGSVPHWVTAFVICAVVLTYVFVGGLRAAAWANTFQTIVFMVIGVIAFYLISTKLGGLENATAMAKPEKLVRGDKVPQLVFLTYLFIPLSVGMFPHLFQHWLTAKSAKTFRLTVIAHPIFIMIVWVPCILIGVWASGAVIETASGLQRVVPEGAPPNAVLGIMVKQLTSETMSGFVTAGILAAIMSSLDSQFMCLGTMFTNDVVMHHFGKNRFNDNQQIWMARGFITLIVIITYLLSLAEPRSVFVLGIWCFSGFASLFPLAVAAVYWKRATKAAAYATVIVTMVVWFVLFQDSNYGLEREYHVFGMMPVAIIFAASTLTMILVSLFTKPPSKETITKFFPDKRMEVASA
ncbi:MAG: sodium:solute symporter family protein [Candidatus Hinthialibacter antarcticus]|nr:sodium:solute symporter family protein [Candidatus Hinthialibacter antarcticus]